MKRIAALLIAISFGVAHAQTILTPNIGLQIPSAGSTNWNIPLNYNFNLLDQLIGVTLQSAGVGLQIKPSFGIGATTLPCTNTNQGQNYYDTSTSPFTAYVCNSSTWSLAGGGGSGGGAALPTNSLVFGLSPTTARGALPSDVNSLLGALTGCSTSGYLYSPASNQCLNGITVYPASGIPTSTGSAWGSSYSTSGSGNVALTTSPVFVTPTLGFATASAINGAPVGEDTAHTNVYLGDNIALPSSGTTISDTMVGSGALSNDQGAGLNAAFGKGSLNNNTTGSSNAALGLSSLAGNNTGSNNAAGGADSLFTNTTGSNLVAFGASAGVNNTSGNNNTFLGFQSGNDNTIGSGNISIGYQSGLNGTTPNTNESNSVYIGNLANSTINNAVNQIVIGFGAQGTTSNQTVIGNGSTTTVLIYGIPTFPGLAGHGVGCVGITNVGLTSVVTCGSGGGTGNTTSTSLTSGTIPVANGANSIINSLLTDSGTQLAYSGSGGFAITATTPGIGQFIAGTGSIPGGLQANSASLIGPVTGGTSYGIQFMNAVTASGILHLATPATVYGVRVAQLTNSLIAIPDFGATGTPGSGNFLRGDNTWSIPTREATLSGGINTYGTYGATTFLGGTVTVNAGHFTNLEVVNTSLTTCTTAPTINVYDDTLSTTGTSTVGSTTGNVAGTGSARVDTGQTMPFNAGDKIAIKIQTQGASCSNFFTVNAQYVTQ